nr:hypothetical protein [uncultured Rhodopila sp.]
MGINARLAPDKVPPGMLCGGENLRMRDGEPSTRLGVIKPAWLNRMEGPRFVGAGAQGVLTATADPITQAISVIPLAAPAFGGVGVFKDPTSTEWTLLVADGQIWRCIPNNARVALPLPSGVALWGPCVPVQAFDQVYLFRGRNLQPLVMTDINEGFKDLLPRWDAASTFQAFIQATETAADQVAYGPFQPIASANTVDLSAAGAGTYVVFRTAAEHGYVTGADVTIKGCRNAAVNGRWNIVVMNPNAFQIPMTLPQDVSNELLVTSITRGGAGNLTATVTAPAHGFVIGQQVTIAGASPLAFNGTWTVAGAAANTFTFLMQADPGANAVGDIVAIGVMTVSNMSLYWTALGTRVTVTGITPGGVGNYTATVTAAGHGFSNGQYVTIAGATPVGYNGIWVIQNVTANTFDYVMTLSQGTSPIGTITAQTSVVLPGQSPDTNPEAWAQAYNILPNADDALFINNRLLVPTSYTPGDNGYDLTSEYTKKDYIVATDIQDDLHFDFINQFRINAGDDDEIVALVKYSNSVAAVFKGRSWGLIANIAMDLSGVTLDMRRDDYGCCALRAAVAAGSDVMFASNRRGILTMMQSQYGLTRCVDVPLSNDFDAVVKRINWSYADQIRLAYWNDCLYCAVPLDDAMVWTGEDLVASAVERAEAAGGAGVYSGGHTQYGYVTLTGLRIGQWYDYTAGNSAALSTQMPGKVGASFTAGSGRFQAMAPTYYAWGAQGVAPTAMVQPFYSGRNNAIMVYDFRQGAQGTMFTGDWRPGQWAALDTGTALCVQEWFIARYMGQERLFFVAVDGTVNMMEEAWEGDQVLDGGSATGLSTSPIATEITTRGYGAEGLKKVKRLELSLGVWNATVSVGVGSQAAGAFTPVRSSLSFSRTKYLKPAGRADYVEANANGDWAQPGRGDYSVRVIAGGVKPGVSAGQWQEVIVRPSLRPMQARYVQFQISSSTGRIKLKGLGPEKSEGQRRSGILV